MTDSETPMGDTTNDHLLDYNSQVFSLATIPAGSTLGQLLKAARKDQLNNTVVDGVGSGKKRLRTYNSIIKGYFNNTKSILNPADDSHSDIGFEKSNYRPHTDKRHANFLGRNPDLPVAKKPKSLTSTPTHANTISNPIFTDRDWLKNNKKPMGNGIVTTPSHAALLDFIDETAESKRSSAESEPPKTTISAANGQIPSVPSRHLFKVTQVELRPKSLSFGATPDVEADRHTTVQTVPVAKQRKTVRGFPPSTKAKSGGRLVNRSGECNLSNENVPNEKWKYIRDIFTTLVDSKWRWSILIFSLAFVVSWALFGAIYYIIAVAHEDHLVLHLGNESFIPCVQHVHSFVTAFLYSVETQTTVGYGSRYTTDECPTAIITMCIQSLLGILIQTFMTGFVFAKLARPEKRAETLIFSKNAVISMRDGRLCFLFRVGDMRKSHIVEAHIRLQCIKKRLTAEGELLPFHQFDMNVGFQMGLDRIFLVWPITICHVIDEDSPLYGYSASDLAGGKFEIVAILEGVVESRGMTTQARTSYLPKEILWGHRFEKLVTYQRHNGEYRIDYARFHSTYPVSTPSCSARELDEQLGHEVFDVVSSEGEEVKETRMEDECDRVKRRRHRHNSSSSEEAEGLLRPPSVDPKVRRTTSVGSRLPTRQSSNASVHSRLNGPAARIQRANSIMREADIM